MSAGSASIDSHQAKARSRVSNGSSLFLIEHEGQAIDGRTTIARRFRDILADVVSDLGGRDQISEGEYQLARRAAALSVHAEVQEAWLACQQFERFDAEIFVKLVNGLNRTFGSLGLRRRAKDVTPSLQSIIEGTAE